MIISAMDSLSGVNRIAAPKDEAMDSLPSRVDSRMGSFLAWRYCFTLAMVMLALKPTWIGTLELMSRALDSPGLSVKSEWWICSAVRLYHFEACDSVS